MRDRIKDIMEESKNNSKEGLERFLTAQDGKTIYGNTLYEQALKEIREGKLGFECWVRYVYPQMKGLGTSQVTEFFGINGREEANQFINHPILKERLIKAAQVLLDTDKPIYETFSKLGILKVRASMRLFASVSDEPVFKQVINKYRW
jgi:uncharacterized protein (DUF1810 family)